MAGTGHISLRYTMGTTIFHGGKEVGRITVECPVCYEPMEVPVLLRSINVENQDGTAVIEVNVGVDEFIHNCKKDR